MGLVTMACEFVESPIGWLKILASDAGVTCIDFDVTPEPGAPGNTITRQCGQQLQEYFAGKRTTFEVPLDAGGTAFQQSVWQALQKIPFGATRCYQDIAHAIGRPTATRAVGAANGRNPVPIIVPCHRVIGRNGNLTGFSGGLDKKEWLLKHEGVLLT